MAKISMMQRKTILNTTWAVQILFVSVQICMLALQPSDLKAQSDVADIVIPVSGRSAFLNSATDTALIVDTMTGDSQVIGDNLSAPFYWNSAGDKLVFWKFDADAAYYDFMLDSVIQITDIGLNKPDDLVFPVGWSQTSQEQLYLSGIIGPNFNVYSFYRYNWTTNALVELSSYQTNTPLTGIPLDATLTSSPLLGIMHTTRNPVWDDWITIQFRLTDDNPEQNSTDLIDVYVLWNFVTHQMISLQSLFQDRMSELPLDWSSDGKYLLVTTGSSTFHTHIVRFSPDGTLSIKESVDVTSNDTPLYFLDAGNLIISLDRDATSSSDEEIIYNIAEIVDGNWVETEFFRLNGAYQAGDWHITASDEEKKTLSCIFDQTLPAQLQPDQRGQVAFTGGTPSRLRTAPGTDNEVILQMPEGTSFDVLTTPECRDGYRWWQIQLDDGTTGYAAEASTTEYFLELLEITATDEEVTP